MPIKGAKVRRGEWFHETVQILEAAGFVSGAPGVYSCPGFYYFSREMRDGWAIVQIKPKMRLELTFPNGSRAEYRDVVKLMDDLDASAKRFEKRATQDLRRPCDLAAREHNSRSIRSAALIPIILVLMIGLVGFAQQPTRKMVPLRSRVPAAKPEKYRHVRDAAQWKNPCLIVKPNGVQIWVNGAALTGPTIPVLDVIGYLEKLPDRSWFYGLVVAVQENSIVGSKDDIVSIKHNFSELLQRLKDAGVRAELWPSG